MITSQMYQEKSRQDFYMEKRGNIWYVKFRDPASKKILWSKSSRCTNQKQAIRWAEIHWQEMNTPNANHNTKTFKEAAELFFTERCPHITRLQDENRHYADTTRKQNRSLLERFIFQDKLAGMKLTDIRRHHILEFRAELLIKLEGKKRTAIKVMAVLSIIYKEFIYRELINHDPTVGITKIHYTPKERPVMTAEETARFLRPQNFSDMRYFNMTNFAFQTGMRAGEVRAITIGDIDPEKKTIYINKALREHSSKVGTPKWDKLRSTVISDSLLYILEGRENDPPETLVFKSRRNTPIGYYTWKEEVKKAGEKAGISILVTPHVLRHTLHNLLRQAGVQDILLRASFGWSNSKVQENYTHESSFNLSPVSCGITKMMKQLENT